VDRFLVERVDGLLHDATRPPGKSRTSDEKRGELGGLAMSPPPRRANYRPLRALATKIGGMVNVTVRNILGKRSRRRRRVKTFKVSRDPEFEKKIHD